METEIIPVIIMGVSSSRKASDLALALDTKDGFNLIPESVSTMEHDWWYNIIISNGLSIRINPKDDEKKLIQRISKLHKRLVIIDYRKTQISTIYTKEEISYMCEHVAEKKILKKLKKSGSNIMLIKDMEMLSHDEMKERIQNLHHTVQRGVIFQD